MGRPRRAGRFLSRDTPVERRILLTGRAGSGKTRRILERAREEILRGEAASLLLILPTRSQVDHLRGRLLEDGVPGFRDDFLHNFFTLSRSLVRDAPGSLLTAEGRDFLLGDLLREERLPAFAGVRSFPGFREVLGRAFQELKQNRIGPRDYDARILAPLGGEGSAAPRHADLGRALAAYEKRKSAQGSLDQDDLLLSALERLETDPKLLADRRLLLVDGFHDFTPVQLRILLLLAERTAESIFTLSLDPDRLDHQAFRPAEATRRALLEREFREEPCRGNHRTTDPTLRRLEADLFAPVTEKAEAGAGLRLVRASRREDEVEGIARAILRLTREEGVPYREIAVLYHDLGEIGDLLSGTFRRFGIPLRIYQPRPLDRQPIARFQLELGRLLARSPQRDPLLRLLRSGYVTGLDPAEVDRLDETLRQEAAPVAGRDWIVLCEREKLPAIRGVLEKLGGAARRLAGNHTQRFLAGAWRAAFESLALPLGEDGPAGAEECAAREAFDRLVEEAGARAGFGKRPITFGLLLERVQEALPAAEFRPPDRRREVVNAIDVQEARQWEVPHLFVAGLLEKQFPPAPTEDLFFDDEDRRRLCAKGLRFPDREWRQAEERFLFYTAVTRARVRLQISSAATDARGNPTLKSSFLHEVERLFTPGSLEHRTLIRSPAAVLPLPEEMTLEEDLDRAILLGLEERYPRRAVPYGVALAAALYQRRIADAGFRSRLAGLLVEPAWELRSPEIRQAMADREMTHSASSLESFLQCPYLHFARKWLRLDAPPGRELEPIDAGQALHDALKEVVAGGAGLEEGLEALDRHFARQAAGREPTFRQRADGWRLRRDLARFLRDEAERRGGPLVPRRFEQGFGGMGRDEAPPVELEVGGRTERLSGRIDRVDQDPEGHVGLVVDYKYSREQTVRDQLKASAGEEIGRFQIAIYLLALAASLGLEPLGAELVALRDGVERFGIGRRRFADEGRLPAGFAAAGGQLLDESEYAALLARARERMGSLMGSIRSGSILARPLDETRCGPGNCEAADVCRFDRWIGGKKEEG